MRPYSQFGAGQDLFTLGLPLAASLDPSDVWRWKMFVEMTLKQCPSAQVLPWIPPTIYVAYVREFDNCTEESSPALGPGQVWGLRRAVYSSWVGGTWSVVHWNAYILVPREGREFCLSSTCYHDTPTTGSSTNTAILANVDRHLLSARYSIKVGDSHTFFIWSYGLAILPHFYFFIYFLKLKKIILFIFGCVGSLLLHAGFL